MADFMQSTNPRKRQRLEEDIDSDVPTSESVETTNGQHNTAATGLKSQPVDGLPAAMRVILALQRAKRHLRAIGVCPTKHAAQIEMMLGNGPRPDDKNKYHQVIFSGEEALGQKASTEEQKAKAAQDRRNKERFGTLKDVADANSRNYAYGFMDEPFNLRVNRPGCEFDGPISPNRSSHKSKVWNAKEHDLRWEIHTRLQKWYNNASVSGFGDVREQVTKIDESVRTAREIGTSEFTVGDELLRRVEDIWKEQFVPGCDVRAEPYKIHLYGPGGHFDTHRDTPQKDLMGTFLVGLGDTADHGALVIDGKHLKAHPGSWCAFYPDVPHEVTRLSDGYRAVIAFKIFRASSSTGAGDGDTEKTAEVRRRLAEVVPKMEAPYGLLLEHKYCLGTDEFSGFDELLVDAVRAHSSGRFDVHHLPVVVSSWSVWGSENDDPYEEYAVHCSTNVYPFTNGHIDYLNTVPAEESYGNVTHTACGCAWLKGVKDLQFYAVDLSRRTMFPFKHEKNETCNHVGNEAQAWREDSVYLSYALLVLPKATAKGKAEEEEKVGEGSEYDEEESEFEQGGEEDLEWDSEGSDYEVDEEEEEEDSEENESGEEEAEE